VGRATGGSRPKPWSSSPPPETAATRRVRGRFLAAFASRLWAADESKAARERTARAAPSRGSIGSVRNGNRRSASPHGLRPGVPPRRPAAAGTRGPSRRGNGRRFSTLSCGGRFFDTDASGPPDRFARAWVRGVVAGRPSWTRTTVLRAHTGPPASALVLRPGNSSGPLSATLRRRRPRPASASE
jgi:hypothetical protein